MGRKRNRATATATAVPYAKRVYLPAKCKKTGRDITIPVWHHALLVTVHGGLPFMPAHYRVWQCRSNRYTTTYSVTARAVHRVGGHRCNPGTLTTAEDYTPTPHGPGSGLTAAQVAAWLGTYGIPAATMTDWVAATGA